MVISETKALSPKTHPLQLDHIHDITAENLWGFESLSLRKPANDPAMRGIFVWENRQACLSEADKQKFQASEASGHLTVYRTHPGINAGNPSLFAGKMFNI